MTPELHRLRLGSRGRVVIPAGIRRELGFRDGDALIASIERDRLVLRSREAVERELRDMFGDVEGSLSEELTAERRHEARREA